MISLCLLCGRVLAPAPSGLYQVHPPVEDCLVNYTDLFGVALDDPPVGEEPAIPQTYVHDPDLLIQTYPLVDVVLDETFVSRGLTRLGGASSGRGWSSFSMFQTCPYKWKRRYIENAKPLIFVESPSRAIGSIFHALMALYYEHMIEGSPYRVLEPKGLYDRLLARANPVFVQEGWRIFTAYALYYKFERIEPLCTELDLRDPRTGESCRYDMIAFFPDEAPMRVPGTYIVEHKSASRFDHATLAGWPNDGEVLGQVALWDRLGLDRRWGPLKGVIVNITGKQKEPQFHRTIVAPPSWQIEQHLSDLKKWEGLIQLARSTDSFPRARQSCNGRYGLCDWFEHCATGD